MNLYIISPNTYVTILTIEKSITWAKGEINIYISL